MTKKDLVYKICNETYHMRKIIDSCETNEQIHNANRLACSLVDKWYNLNANFSLSYGADALSYIASAANDMTKFIEEAKKKLLYNISEENQGAETDLSKHNMKVIEQIHEIVDGRQLNNIIKAKPIRK